MYRIKFEDLDSANFISGVVYESAGGGYAKEPLHRLFKIDGFRGLGTQSGIRRGMVESKGKKGEAFIALINSQSIDEWKNEYNPFTKILKYYGDNRIPGNDIFNTKQQGNVTLKKIYNLSYGDSSSRSKLPPIFYFERTGARSDMKFVGLAIPFVNGLSLDEALAKKNFKAPNQPGEFENYEAKFTIIDNLHINREWLRDLKLGNLDYSPYAPEEWIEFISKGEIRRKGIRNDSISGISDSIEINHSKVAELEVRLTQNKFRKNLTNKYKVCQICGISLQEVLIASHIKPWKKSNNNEKLDINNGLLLCANHDKLFDRNLISFDENGRILISSIIMKEEYSSLNINESIVLYLTEAQKQYMTEHRKSFKK